jgi:methylmalonyl-CoA epimerase
MTDSSAPERTVTVLRRLDHVGIAVRSTETALAHFRDRLGLAVVTTDDIESPRVRLTYLDCGNAYLQLVQPLDTDNEIARFLDEHGEGIHHICFGVDDVPHAVAELSEDAGSVALGSGRGRMSAFIPGPIRHGVRLECTEFRREQDVDDAPGWLPGIP